MKQSRLLSTTFILVCMLLSLGINQAVRAAQAAPFSQATRPSQQNYKVTIYFFWGDGCPHCAKAKPFLALLQQQQPGITIRDFEVWYSKANREPFTKMAAKFGFEPQAVPTIFIGTRHWEGFSDQISQDIESYTLACRTAGCVDAGKGVFADAADGISPVDQSTGDTTVQTNAPAITPAVAQPPLDQLSLPILGTIDLHAQSLAVSTAVIAFVDGVNPCSLWVLSILLTLTLHTGSRRKVFFIGAIFITVTAAVYMLFITGLFTMFTVVNFIGWIQFVVALVALFFAGVNIKDYFWYKEGFSFTIADSNKPGIYKRMRNLLDPNQSLWGLAGATVVLAGGVSLVEFSCTAGFPVLWTNLLVSQQVTTLTFLLLLALYMVIYQLDEIGIFLAAVVTLRSSRLEEKHGRILKLIGGMLMLTLAIVMLVNPSLMNNLGTSLVILGLALGATLLALLAHRVLLPRCGIYIGTENGFNHERAGKIKAGHTR